MTNAARNAHEESEEEGRLLTLEDVRRLTQFRETKVKQMIRTGELKSFVHGRLRRVRWSDYLAWVQGRDTSQ